MASERKVKIKLTTTEQIKCPHPGCTNTANVLEYGDDFMSHCVTTENGDTFFTHVMEFNMKTLVHLRGR